MNKLTTLLTLIVMGVTLSGFTFGKKEKIKVCHKGKLIEVSANSINGHLNHGDVVIDADGDGYTAKNECGYGTQDDCDDNNANVNPGSEEVCGNDIDENCNGNVGTIQASTTNFVPCPNCTSGTSGVCQHISNGKCKAQKTQESCPNPNKFKPCSISIIECVD